MKILKRVLLVIFVIIVVTITYNYPKLNILAGYSAKSMASSVFVADRTVAYTDSTDNNFSPVNLASDTVDFKNKTAISSAFGLLTRKALSREGVGAVLLLNDEDANVTYLKPKRSEANTMTAFPYGSGVAKDTVFTNINYDKINLAIDKVFDESHTRAFLVIHKDYIVTERYKKGFDKNSKFLGWSMTKSIMATVFGVLEHQNKIDVMQNAPIKSWQKDQRKNIKIHNLLQMNSGLEWDEDYGTISDATTMLFLERDMTKLPEEKELTGKINASWNYSSGTSNILSGILRKQFPTHQEYLDFWYTDFIDKIGMNSMLVETDLAGNYVASSYSWATVRDWAKFGLLYLHKGNWNGTQIFNESWVDYITTPTPTSNGRYGAQFWLNTKGKFPNIPKNLFYADGYQGQRVYILPDQELVIVRFGLENFDENRFLESVLESFKI